MDYLSDDFFDGLTREEIDQINSELCDDLLPACDRVKYHIEKEGQSTVDKAALNKWMEEAAIASQIGRDYIPYTKETRGRVYVRPEEKKEKTVYDDEFEKLLAEAEGAGGEDITDGDIDALAEILGANSLLGSVDVSSCSRPGRETGLKNPVTHDAQTLLDIDEMDEVNETDVDLTLEQIENNDSTLTHCCLNNIPLEQEKANAIITALINNTYVKILDMSNCYLTDDVIEGIITMLKANSTLHSLSIETNRINGASLKNLVQSLDVNESLKELRIANQYYTTGVGDEMAISKALGVNKFILKFSLNWKNGGARNAADRHIMRNNDISRQKRQGQL